MSLNVTQKLMDYTREHRPDLYEAILSKIQPYSLESVLRIFHQHVLHVEDISLFNEHIDVVPDFVWAVIRHMQFPAPGDAFGVNVVCRVTKSDTQSALDSKHLQAITHSRDFEFNVEKEILEELALFSSHIQIFELANRHKYATVFMSRETTLGDVAERLLPDSGGVLSRGNDFNKGLSSDGTLRYLDFFQFILVEDRGSVKVLYKTLNDLFDLLRRLPLGYVSAFSDVRCLFKKGGATCAFFNMVEVARRQLFSNDHSQYETDVVTLLTFMFCRGELLPMNREGLAKTKDRPPIDVLSFEAMKRNCSRLATGPERGKWHEVQSSLESVFMGMQIKEGSGYHFELHNEKKDAPTSRETFDTEERRAGELNDGTREGELQVSREGSGDLGRLHHEERDASTSREPPLHTENRRGGVKKRRRERTEWRGTEGSERETE